MDIIYNEKSRFQRENIIKAIEIVKEVLLQEEFYNEISEVKQFYNAQGYNGKKISQLTRDLVDSEETIYIEHYFPTFARRPFYRSTNAVVFSHKPYIINLLAHRINRDVFSLAETIVHEFIHCVDGVEEYKRGKRVSWGFTHTGSRDQRNKDAAPNKISLIARSYFKNLPLSTLPPTDSFSNLDEPFNYKPQSLSKLDYIAVGENGEYSKKGYYQYSENDVDNLVTYIKNKGITNLVIYFHGGLVNESDGAQSVQRVIEYIPPFDSKGVHAIGFIWKTGIMETLSENLSGKA